MPLDGIKVVELAGLVPAPYCGMILGDFGAHVIRIDKFNQNTDLDCLANGKKSISLNLKDPKGVEILKKICKESDVLIEPFRSGVMERLGLGPDVLLKENPSLIYARLTGYGQSGFYARNPGHDINYVAVSGLLSLFGRKNENPFPPLILAGDMGGGGLMCVMGILLALIERNKSGLGQVVDNTMVHGIAYLGSWCYRSQRMPIWGEQRGTNILDGGAHFYNVYKTKDGKFMSVGTIEPHFYTELLKGLGLDEDETPQVGDFVKLKELFRKKFLEKTRDEWCKIFDSTDACVAPVLELTEAPKHPHNSEPNIFVETKHGVAPIPAPVLKRTPGKTQAVLNAPQRGEHTKNILLELGYTEKQIQELENEDVIECFRRSKL